MQTEGLKARGFKVRRRKEQEEETYGIMMDLTEAGNAQDHNEVEDEFITPHIVDDFDTGQLIKAEDDDEEKESDEEDALRVISKTVASKMKTEPANEDKTTVDHKLDTIIKQEVIDDDDDEDNPEFSYGSMPEDEIVSQMKATENEANDPRSALKSENDDLPLIIPDIDSEQESMSDTSDGMDKQQDSHRIDKREQIFQKHVKTHCSTDETGRTCSECGKVFDTSQTCLQHMWLSHTGEKPYKCKVCGKDFKRMYHLKCHKVIHLNERPHSCDACDKTFKLKVTLQRHIAACHSDERPFSCDLCDKTFKLRCDLQRHKALRHSCKKPLSCYLNENAFRFRKRKEPSHSGERPFSCDLCEKTFNRKSNLQRHKETCHSSERPYACNVCEKAFKQKPHLQRHEEVCHSNERPYSCDVCEKTFKQKSHLQEHKAWCHSDERPHLCDDCGKSFKVKSHLVLHKKIHTGEKPYACEICGKAFLYKQSASLHILLVHKKQDLSAPNKE